jgi:hypothetical protein
MPLSSLAISDRFFPEISDDLMRMGVSFLQVRDYRESSLSEVTEHFTPNGHRLILA